MTSATGERRADGAGFSLLEMVVSLAIVGILSGWFVLRFGESREERLLGGPAADLRLLSQRTLRQATAFREEYTMRFTQAEIGLWRGRGRAGDPVESIPLPEGVVVSLRRAGEERWTLAEDEPWLFRPAGVCEPIEVRLASGGAYVELAFEALTARAEERAHFP